jgi:hypothetical protein
MLARDFRGAPAVEIGVALRVAVVGINGGGQVVCFWLQGQVFVARCAR